MRAKEFTEAESNTPNAREIESTLTRAGYKKLGSGADATVWSKDEDTVIKILMPDTAGDTATKTFIKFYEFSQKHQDVPCLPKFREIGGVHHAPFVIGDTEYTQIAMERLYPIPSGSFAEAMVWILSDLATKPMSWEQVLQIISDESTWQGFEYPKKIEAVLRTIDQWDDRDRAEYSLLFTVMQLLYTTGRINKMGWDLHTENVMQRKNGSLVIVDPWFAAVGDIS
jgi:hypothetical protein